MTTLPIEIVNVPFLSRQNGVSVLFYLGWTGKKNENITCTNQQRKIISEKFIMLANLCPWPGQPQHTNFDGSESMELETKLFFRKFVEAEVDLGYFSWNWEHCMPCFFPGIIFSCKCHRVSIFVNVFQSKTDVSKKLQVFPCYNLIKI